MLSSLHHIAIICSDYERSKLFYTDILGLEVIREEYRAERDSYKLDLALNGQYIIELFSFPDPPKRATRPEATGLRHIAFGVENLDDEVARFTGLGIDIEPIRVDEATHRRFTFLMDPDELPIELYEIG